VEKQLEAAPSDSQTEQQPRVFLEEAISSAHGTGDYVCVCVCVCVSEHLLPSSCRAGRTRKRLAEEEI